jgi:predicted glycogen debranching enzyme
MNLPKLALDASSCSDPAHLIDSEWWLANGIGGYAGGSVSGILTRRYHGLLVAPVQPPLGRQLLFAKADAVVRVGERSVPLHSNQWAGGIIAPQGYQTLKQFQLDGQMPLWLFEAEGLRIEQRIWMDHGHNRTQVAFRLLDEPSNQQPLTLEIGLLASARDHHAVSHAETPPLHSETIPEGLSWHLPDGSQVEVRGKGGVFTTEQTWIEGFHLAREQERGLEAVDRHQRIGVVSLPLPAGEWVGLSIAFNEPARTDLAASLAEEKQRLTGLLETVLPDCNTDSPPDWISQLIIASDSYRFQRIGDSADILHSVIAGYPWFGDWGRDTMIALPGLTLATGRPEIAKQILETFAGYVSEGMLPNVFPGAGDSPEYNTVDAALWFIEAWRAYVESTDDLETLERMFPTLLSIIHAYRDGTRYGIAMDPSDGLIRAGVPGQQLTWMDARVDGREVTPRHGKPVEINALWYNALKAMSRFAQLLGSDSDPFEQISAQVRQNFARYHRGGRVGLYDVLDGPAGDDASIRPNQIFAISLPHSPLDSGSLRRYVLEECRRHLLTPFGLRSLAPSDPLYCGRYEGGVPERDAAYHQGPAWGWLLGHFALAEYRVTQDAAAAQRRLDPVRLHLRAAGLGQVSEIFDGDAPHTPRGTPAQAWSVACTLEAWWRLQQVRLKEQTENPENQPMNAERERLEQQRRGSRNWRLWGPYLSERAWGTVREDYSPHGTAWEYFDHDQARSRAYRWNEDGISGISDESQYLCFALALWNGQDPILKERAFGLTGNQGNRGEDVKEYYFYQDATPTHSYMRYLYKYPQQAFPYQQLIEENARRGRDLPPFNLLDTGVMDESRYWDVEVAYAKADPGEIHIRIVAHNHGPDRASIHLIPTLWFRNTWTWEEDAERPRMLKTDRPDGCAWALESTHPQLGSYWLYGEQAAEELFTENESNASRLWDAPDQGAYVKDAFHRRIIDQASQAVNPDQQGTKFAAWSQWEVEPDHAIHVNLVLSEKPLEAPFAHTTRLFSERRSEADVYYDEMLPEASPGDMQILRKAASGLIWTKQFFHFDVERWLRGDQLPPPAIRHYGRNNQWRHLRAGDVISMPDKWEYPWFAAWDLAYHCMALALVDVDFAKHQIELMLNERYLHPNGQVPAYEWAFGDVNPPVHAMGALKVFRAERVQRGKGDLSYLQRVFNKLLMNFAWWINRKDAHGNNLFEGGFLGLDNISVYDRSRALPDGYSLKQADATGWMAMFALNLTVMALELSTEDPEYEEMAIQCYLQFQSIAEAIAGRGMVDSASLWDMEAGFFKDLLITPEGESHYVDVYSWVGLIPLFATEVIDQRLLDSAPRFHELLRSSKGGLFHGSYICACPDWKNERNEHLLALVDHSMLPRILNRLLDESQFLSPYGVRSVSKVHETYRDLGWLPGIGEAYIEYNPGESTSGMFGGNSNWRGPVWLPTNYSLIQAIEKFHRFLGPNFVVEAPCLGHQKISLQQIANLISDRLVNLYRRDQGGTIPALRRDSPFQSDPAWRDQLFFYEYFHGETGQGLGAAHQTGWTALLANLVMRRYQKDIKPWSGLDSGERAAWIDELA